MNHTFAICAYKESAYLEKCIKSLKNQTIKSNIILVTSTPNDFLEEISKINVDKIKSYGDVEYYFKRNR